MVRWWLLAMVFIMDSTATVAPDALGLRVSAGSGLFATASSPPKRAPHPTRSSAAGHDRRRDPDPSTTAREAPDRGRRGAGQPASTNRAPPAVQPPAFDFDEWHRDFLLKARTGAAQPNDSPPDAESEGKMQAARLAQQRLDDLGRDFGERRLQLRRDQELALRPLLAERRRWTSQLPLFWYFAVLDRVPGFFATPDPTAIKEAQEALLRDEERVKEGLLPLNADPGGGILGQVKRTKEADERLVSDQELFAEFVEDVECETSPLPDHRAGRRGNLPDWAESTIVSEDDQDDDRSSDGLHSEDSFKVTIRFRESAPKVHWESRSSMEAGLGRTAEDGDSALPVGFELSVPNGSSASVSDGFPSDAFHHLDRYVLQTLPLSRRELYFEVRGSDIGQSFQVDEHMHSSRRLFARSSVVDFTEVAKTTRARYFGDSFLRLFVSAQEFASLTDTHQHRLQTKVLQLTQLACHSGTGDPLGRYAEHLHARHHRLSASDRQPGHIDDL